MANTYPPGVLDDRVLKNIRFHANGLHAASAMPGVDRLDLEQDLIADLLHRSRSYDPTRASFPTFADRVVRHRRATLASPTSRLIGEREWVSIDDASRDGDPKTLIEVLGDYTAVFDEEVGLRLDVRRFVRSLPDRLLDCCDILLADSVAAGAASTGVHRSTAYEWLAGLRVVAGNSGLGIYLRREADSPAAWPVDGDDDTHLSETEMHLQSRFVAARPIAEDADVIRWLAEADAGEILEYFRGFLLFDLAPFSGRLSERDRAELAKVSSRLRAAFDQGRIHLLQRRHGADDYSYLAIARPLPAHRGGSR